jgi:hypothetical protein
VRSLRRLRAEADELFPQLWAEQDLGELPDWLAEE